MNNKQSFKRQEMVQEKLLIQLLYSIICKGFNGLKLCGGMFKALAFIAKRRKGFKYSQSQYFCSQACEHFFNRVVSLSHSSWMSNWTAGETGNLLRVAESSTRHALTSHPANSTIKPHAPLSQQIAFAKSVILPKPTDPKTEQKTRERRKIVNKLVNELSNPSFEDVCFHFQPLWKNTKSAWEKQI